MKKERSRILILSAIAQFSLSRTFGDQRTHGGLLEYSFIETRAPSPGTLVALQAAPSSKWYLSWVVSCGWPENHACMEYALESIEDGEICNWSNVSVWAMPRTTTDGHPEWRWTDKQHEFNDRWTRLCHKDRNAHSYLPCRAKFYDDGKNVSVELRSRFNFDETFHPNRWFDDWRKVTDAELLAFYDEAVAEQEAKLAAAAAKAERKRLRFC